jgi:hypothetical protein
MKRILLILTLLISLVSCGQTKVEEIIINGNGKVISKTEIKGLKNKSENKSPEKTIELFYKNQNNIKVIDSLMSFRFYQKTPYVKFKEILNEKNKLCGEFLENTLIKTQKSEDNNAIAFTFKVKYKKEETIEEIGLLKESENSDFQIFTYNIKQTEK